MVTCDAHLAERQDSSDYPLMAGDLALNMAAAEPADFPWRSAASGWGRVIPTHLGGLHRKTVLREG